MAGCRGEEIESRGLKPIFLMVLDVRAEARTYLRSSSGGLRGQRSGFRGNIAVSGASVAVSEAT
jgi:hypothetical protein